jgi:hypothetical protein
LAKPVVLRPENVEPGITPGRAPKLSSIESPERPKKLKSAAWADALNATTTRAEIVEMKVRFIGSCVGTERMSLTP